MLVGTDSRLYLVDKTKVVQASPEVREVSGTIESTAHVQTNNQSHDADNVHDHVQINKESRDRHTINNTLEPQRHKQLCRVVMQCAA